MFSGAHRRASSLGIGLDFGMSSVKSSSNTMNPSIFEQNVEQIVQEHIINGNIVKSLLNEKMKVRLDN